MDVYVYEILKEMAYIEAKCKIACRAARDAAIGRRTHEITHARQMAARNKINEQRLQTYNKRMTLWRRRNRTCR